LPPPHRVEWQGKNCANTAQSKEALRIASHFLSGSKHSAPRGPQRSFQPSHLGLAAFDHLLAPNPAAQANHTSGEENSTPKQPPTAVLTKKPIQAVMELV
jgi:hypothetical protein